MFEAQLSQIHFQMAKPLFLQSLFYNNSSTSGEGQEEDLPF